MSFYDKELSEDCKCRVLVFSKENIKNYLDSCIKQWRLNKKEAEGDGPAATNDHKVHTASCYVDAYQSVRISLFGECLK